MTGVELPITDIPPDVFESISEQLSHYTVGFVRIVETPHGQHAELLGSGTLVQIDNIYAVLTAHHVVEVLPTKGRLGLVLSRELRRHTIDVQGLTYLKIARGEIDSDGPDIGAVILSPTIASSIGAIKTFYDLSSRRAQLLSDPPDINRGVWFENGFVAERTVHEPGRSGYRKIVGFNMLSGAGGPEEDPTERGEYDYLSLPVVYGPQSEAPLSFKGMSGGGLWQALLMSGPNAEIRPKANLLSGVVFSQEKSADDRSAIVCHFRKSVYEVAYRAIAGAMP